MPDQSSEITIESLLSEDRSFPPPEQFRRQANVSSEDVYAEAARDPEAFWARQAENIDWFRPYERVLEWDPPYARWFTGGRLNISYNCLDRHVSAGGGEKVAYHWEAEAGETRTITYAELLDDVCRCANALREMGVRKGDRVAIYLPMIPELPVAMLACARIGAPHNVVFGGFSAESLADRINDSEARVLITADGGYRKGGITPLKKNADDALENAPGIERVLLVRRTGEDVPVVEGRDVWWHDAVPRQSAECAPEELDSEDMLYLLYTSGTTAKPKGIVHTTAGYLLGVMMTHRWVFDIKPDDVYWCAADVGWVTGHSYIVYGPLANHTTGVMYEGVPDHPARDRWWSIVERYKVSVLYTAPTAIRAHMKWGVEHAEAHDLSSLRLLGSVGEPINPEAWLWYYRHIGGERCPVVDTWWQTETGAIMISPLPGITRLKPGSATTPLPGIEADVVDEQGASVPLGGGGYLALKSPWPSMLRGIYNDPERYEATYWSRFPGMYFPGDGAKRDADGYYWLLGRVDDVMDVSGHRISTTEVESALVSDQRVAEAAVIGQTDEVTGEAIFAFVILRGDQEAAPDLGEELRRHVSAKIGAIARPKRVMFTPELPKTRSGKIMRRLLRDIANERALGDTTTLADASVVETIREASMASRSDE
jgi:acetyl-CoA synthetase